jgi:3-hydroxybutyryl-CoA dehydratase
MNPQNGYDIEDLSVGMSAEIAKTITDADLVLFAGVSTDVNAVHMDEDFAKTTMFGGRIAHGMLSASLISAVLGNRLPGPGTIYMSQSLRFRAPVRPGETVHARVTVKEVITEKSRVVVDTVCTVGDKVVIDGEATLMATSRRSAKPPASSPTTPPPCATVRPDQMRLIPQRRRSFRSAPGRKPEYLSCLRGHPWRRPDETDILFPASRRCPCRSADRLCRAAAGRRRLRSLFGFAGSP